MNSNLTLTNSSQFNIADEEVLLRSIPSKIKIGDLSTDALRLLVYYVSKAGPFELAVDSGYFEGTLEEWLQSMKSTLQFKASVETYADLAKLEGLVAGDVVFVRFTRLAYIYDGEAFAAEPEGISISGPSAYDIAVQNGFAGTVPEWLDSLKGEVGDEGEQGLKGDKGDSGINGKSAYDLAVESGFEGDKATWILSLKGDKGEPGADGAKGDAFTYSDFTAEQLEALKGPKGDAFTFADFTSEQLEGLKGAKGEDGVNGLDGKAFTYEDFTTTQLEGLKGPKGDQGEPGPKGGDGVTQDATTIVLTGLSTADATAAVETDTLLIVIGKLQAQVNSLMARLEALETQPNT